MKTIMFPGQGTQYKGMGKNLFEKYKAKVQIASNVLGYDLEELCLRDPKKELNKTEFTQPALFVVNALKYYEQFASTQADYFIGHSLGEYNALLAAEAFDFDILSISVGASLFFNASLKSFNSLTFSA